MKKILLILITLATAAHAHAWTDAQIKALLIGGGWRSDCGGEPADVFRSDGTIGSAKWDIKDGDYTMTDEIRTYWYKIIYLTKTECLMQGMTSHVKGYYFYYRKPEDIPDILWDNPEYGPNPD
jgi:hypothetical protein